MRPRQLKTNDKHDVKKKDKNTSHKKKVEKVCEWVCRGLTAWDKIVLC